jgi:hypothetical protein
VLTVRRSGSQSFVIDSRCQFIAGRAIAGAVAAFVLNVMARRT